MIEDETKTLQILQSNNNNFDLHKKNMATSHPNQCYKHPDQQDSRKIFK